MKVEEFCTVLGDIYERYIEEAHEPKKAARPVWVKWGALAACLCIVAAAAFAVFGRGDGQSRVITGLSSRSGQSVSTVYAVPEPGTYNCTAAVREARERYQGKDVAFLLGISIHSEEKLSAEERNAEYQRLADLGYRLIEVEKWSYQDDGEKVYQTMVAVILTEEELSNFAVSPDYGYFFYFLKNGDGSKIKMKDYDLITDFSTNRQ